MTDLFGPGLIALPGVTAAATSPLLDTAPLLAVLGVLGSVAVAIRAWRKIGPETKALHAEAERLAAETQQIEDRLRRALLDQTDKASREARDLAMDERAKAAKALAELAVAQSEAAAAQAMLAACEAEGQKERHQLKGLVEALQDENAALVAEVAGLTARLDDIEGRAGLVERRADTEPRRGPGARRAEE